MPVLCGIVHDRPGSLRRWLASRSNQSWLIRWTPLDHHLPPSSVTSSMPRVFNLVTDMTAGPPGRWGSRVDEPKAHRQSYAFLGSRGCCFLPGCARTVSVSGALRFGSSLMGPSVLAAMAEPLAPAAVAPACVWHSASMLGWPGPASREQAGQPLSTHSLVQAPTHLHWFVHQQMFPDYQLPDYPGKL